MSDKTDNNLAYQAGEAAARTEPPERRSPESCPFEVGTGERASWLEGFSNSVNAAPDPATLQQNIVDAIEANDKAVGS